MVKGKDVYFNVTGEDDFLEMFFGNLYFFRGDSRFIVGTEVVVRGFFFIFFVCRGYRIG